MGNRVFTQTEYSGSVASFTGTADSSVTSLIANITPTQDLHGYDSPWPGGGGKNKLNVTATSQTINNVTFVVADDGTITLSGTCTEDTYYRLGNFITENGASYIINGAPSNSSDSKYWQIIYGFGNDGYDFGSGSNPIVGDGTSHIVDLVIKSGINVNNVVFKPMIRLSSEADSTFAPYSNICPITGWTGANVYRTGKNELRFPYADGASKTGNNVTYTVNSLGQIAISCSSAASGDFDFYLFGGPNPTYESTGLPSGTYTFSVSVPSSVTELQMFALLDDGTAVCAKTVGSGNSGTFEIDSSRQYRVLLRVLSGSTINTVVSPMIEVGSQATPYSPYIGSTYPVNWTSEAGTVYGGTVDVVTGKLTVTKVMQTGFTRGSLDTTGKLYNIATPADIQTWLATETPANIIANMFPILGLEASRRSAYPAISQYSTSLYVAGYIGDETTLDGLLPTLSIVYELATPVEYTLTPQEVAVLVGKNNVWSNAGGPVDVIVSSPLQGFHGWLVKVKQGNNLVEIPLTFIRAETYTATPDQRLEWSAERDVTGVLHRETTENTPPKIEFETPLMTNTDIQALNTIIQNGFTNTLGRDVTIQFYNPEKNEYWQWDCYMPDVHYNIRNVDTVNKVINYEQLRYAFIGY